MFKRIVSLAVLVTSVLTLDAAEAVAYGAGGVKGNGNSSIGTMSADGRYLAFRSAATNLTPDDTVSDDDVFARDTVTGETVLVSRATGANGANANFSSLNASISADGRLVVFSSAGTNVDPADTDTNEDIYVRDLQTDTTTLVSRATGAAGAKGNDASLDASISANGRYVVFYSIATNLDPADSDSVADVYVRDLQTNTTTLVSRATGAAGAKGNGDSIAPEISADGRYVVWDSRSTNIDSADTDTYRDVYVRDLQANTTELVSRATGALGAKGLYSGPGFGSANPVISADGRLVAFGSMATNLHPDDPSDFDDTYVRDLQTDTTTLESRAGGATGTKANLPTTPTFFSADGRYLGMRSQATNLNPDDTLTYESAYLRDLQTFTTALVSRASGVAGANANQFTSLPWDISDDGRYVFLISDASNLHPDASTADGFDNFVRDLQDSVTYLESRATTARGYPRPKAATPLFAPLVTAYAPCGSPNRVHAAPLSFNSCAPPDLESGRLTVGTPDANVRAANSVGSARYTVVPGNTATAADEADVSIVFNLTDVREQSGLGDYTGELSVTAGIGLTDRLNGSFRTEPATLPVSDLAVTVPCSGTGDTSIGSICSLTTTADTVIPGMVKESQRSNWEMGQVRVFDGGTDGLASTSGDNTLFAVQGVFIP